MEMINKFLDNLEADKQTLVNNLVEKGIEATNDETFTTLVPKVSEIETGGGDIDWTVIGYEGIPQEIPDAYNYAIEIQNNWDSSKTSYEEKFKNDINLRFMPMVDTSKATKFNYMFGYCYNLISIPCLDIKNGDTFDNAFMNCSSLTSVPEFEFSKGKNFQYMFGYCSSLKSVSGFKFKQRSYIGMMFSYCTNLEEIINFDTSLVYMMGQFCYECKKLKTISALDMSSNENVNGTFYNCKSLTTLGGFLNLGKAYSNKAANNSNYGLSLAQSTLLTHESLMNVINNLYDLNLTYDVPNGGTLYTQKLMLGSTNLAKLTAEEIAIATNKGWTVS